MTEEEYLRACGWEFHDHDGIDMWSHQQRPPVRYASTSWFTTAEAVEAQLAEDRARYNFVRERSWMNGGLLVPIPPPST